LWFVWAPEPVKSGVPIDDERGKRKEEKKIKGV
jgi:hypothetical protein